MPAVRIFIMLLLFLCFKISAQENNHFLMAGARFQKIHNLYFENGISVDYSHRKLWSQRIHFSFNYASSRLGSAIGSNALKQDNYLLSTQLYFRNNTFFSPLIKLNAGWFYADLGSELFSYLPHSSSLLSFEGGAQINLKIPLRIAASLGYNFITGDGMKGPGTLFPLFYQMSIFYVILK